MLSFRPVFADNALFQQNAELVVSGNATPDALVTVSIAGCEGTVFSACARADAAGVFQVSLQTPKGSFRQYEIIACSNKETTAIHHVLFGELWLGSGQSNMELQNISIQGHREFIASLRGKQLRVYSVDYFDDPQYFDFPSEPDRNHHGSWLTADDDLTMVSAMGLKYISVLYEKLNENDQMPVGFLDAAWGGTPICAWLPRDKAEADPFIKSLMVKEERYVSPENWNKRGELNYQQPFAQFNLKIACLLGLKVRGIIWYQGENEAWGEFENASYAHYLRFYYKCYNELFAAEPQSFMVLSSLIYAWTYRESGDCCIGYINGAFVDTADEAPEKFGYMPILDLAPAWSYFTKNHPIHPMLKYPQGERMAKLALSAVYGFDGQKRVASLCKYKVLGSKIRLYFRNCENPIQVGNGKGERVRGLYVAGEDGVYMPAEYEIVANDTMDVWAEGIDAPAHAAYGISSIESEVNLFAGYPVAPFYTDKQHYLKIQNRPWYDMARDSAFVPRKTEEPFDVFFHPVWRPFVPSAELCRDTAFVCTDQVSLRVSASENSMVFGCELKACPYFELDFASFGGISFRLFNTDGVRCRLQLTGDRGAVALNACETDDLGYGWKRFVVDFAGNEQLMQSVGSIEKAAFIFEKDTSVNCFVNMEHLRLLPKKSK